MFPGFLVCYFCFFVPHTHVFFRTCGTGRKTRLLSEGCGIIRTRQAIAAKYNRPTAGAHIHSCYNQHQVLGTVFLLQEL
jgi:hypothetical protein